MKTISIQYMFTMADGEQEIFDLELDSQTLLLINELPDELPFWTKLDYEKCSHCTLDENKNEYCPLAVRLVDLVQRFQKIISYDELNLKVNTEERELNKDTTAQKGLSSLMGLLIATCNCPHTVFFKPMARFHLPLSDRNETVYRATSMYLLAQYFLKKDGFDADMELSGLTKIYKNIETVDFKVSDRLRAACKTDVALNALTLLDTFSKTLPYIIGGSLEEIRYLFKPYFDNVREII